MQCSFTSAAFVFFQHTHLINSLKPQLDRSSSLNHPSVTQSSFGYSVILQSLSHIPTMSHGGPPTAWQKRMHALQAAATAAAADTPTAPRALLPSIYDNPSSSSTSPHASAADDQPLIQYNGGDTHMEDAPNTQENYVSISFTFLQQQ